MNQQVSPCYHSFLILNQSYHFKVSHIGALHAEKNLKQFGSIYLELHSQRHSCQTYLFFVALQLKTMILGWQRVALTLHFKWFIPQFGQEGQLISM